jgi:hypothetical protein
VVYETVFKKDGMFHHDLFLAFSICMAIAGRDTKSKNATALASCDSWCNGEYRQRQIGGV